MLGFIYPWQSIKDSMGILLQVNGRILTTEIQVRSALLYEKINMNLNNSNQFKTNLWLYEISF